MIIEKSINAVRIIDAIYIAEKKRRALMTNYLVKRFIAIRSERRISQVILLVIQNSEKKSFSYSGHVQKCRSTKLTN